MIVKYLLAINYNFCVKHYKLPPGQKGLHSITIEIKLQIIK